MQDQDQDLDDEAPSGLTPFDLSRLDELETDESFTIESNKWTIHHYGDCLVIVGNKGGFKEVKTKQQVIATISKI